MDSDDKQSSPQSINKGNLFRDIILGGQDGLVNVLGIVLGLTAAGSSSKFILAAGLAATFAESISMGAVTYTSFNSQREYFNYLCREKAEMIEKNPEEAKRELIEVYKGKGLSGELLNEIVNKIVLDKNAWVKDIVSLSSVNQHESVREIFDSSIIVFFAALIGSIIPLLPYFFFNIRTSLIIAVIVSAIILFFIGAYKGINVKSSWIKSGIQLLLIGLISAFAGYLIGLVFKVK